MYAFPALYVLASVVAAQTGDTGTPAIGSYEAVMQAQYAARTEPLPQRPQEAQRIYDAYLKAIGQKAEKSETPFGNAEDQSH